MEETEKTPLRERKEKWERQERGIRGRQKEAGSNTVKLSLTPILQLMSNRENMQQREIPSTHRHTSRVQRNTDQQTNTTRCERGTSLQLQSTTAWSNAATKSITSSKSVWAAVGAVRQQQSHGSVPLDVPLIRRHHPVRVFKPPPQNVQPRGNICT